MHRVRVVLLVLVLLADAIALSSPTGPAVASQLGAVEDPVSAAIFYSQLEAEGRFSELYFYMHPDAQAVVPEAAVVGWYQNEFAPQIPGVITVTGVQWVSWTWEVTGVTYPQTAVVSFRQPFGNGKVIEDVVRLVEVNGQWRWFFGRSWEFVNEQIARYAGARDGSDSGTSCAGDAEWWADTYPRIGLAHYRAYGLVSIWNGGYGEPWAMRSAADAFTMFLSSQEQLTPPLAAQPLHDDFVTALSLYQYATSNFAAVLEGRGNPLANSAAIAEAAEALDRADQLMLALDDHIQAFEATCRPLVVFAPTLGGDEPPQPVLPGEPEPVGFMPVDCERFRSQEDAQRFFEASGPGDMYGLDADGDGIACGPGE